MTLVEHRISISKEIAYLSADLARARKSHGWRWSCSCGTSMKKKFRTREAAREIADRHVKAMTK